MWIGFHIPYFSGIRVRSEALFISNQYTRYAKFKISHSSFCRCLVNMPMAKQSESPVISSLRCTLYISKWPCIVGLDLLMEQTYGPLTVIVTGASWVSKFPRSAISIALKRFFSFWFSGHYEIIAFSSIELHTLNKFTDILQQQLKRLWVGMMGRSSRQIKISVYM